MTQNYRAGSPAGRRTFAIPDLTGLPTSAGRSEGRSTFFFAGGGGGG